MAKRRRPIRIGQLIAPFGPGSLYTDRRGIPHVVCGLDHWFSKSDHAGPKQISEEMLEEFRVVDLRLAALLRVAGFRRPPDFRVPRRKEEPPPNALLSIPAHRFPCWYRNSRTGRMRRFNLGTRELERCADGSFWKPVRFVAVCEAGHLDDFPWKQWAGCNCPDETNLLFDDRGGADLSSIKISCDRCNMSRNLLRTTTLKEEESHQEGLRDTGVQRFRTAFEGAGIACRGARPWLGANATQPGCNKPLVAALINQTNLYYPRTYVSITLPNVTPQSEADSDRALKERVEELPKLDTIKFVFRRLSPAAAAFEARKAIGDQTLDLQRIEGILERIFTDEPKCANANTPRSPESELLGYRRVEFNTLLTELDDRNLRTRLAIVADSLKDRLSQVLLVERLTETKAFCGFDRLNQSGAGLDKLPDSAMNQLFLQPPTEAADQWLPAMRSAGEGIFINLREDAVKSWQCRNAAWLQQRCSAEFVQRVAGIDRALPPSDPDDIKDWTSRFLLVHSLAHALISQLVFECGYGTSSLRERLYVSADPDAPMCGLLIYTASGDSDGTLGGLVRLGRKERLELILRRAMNRMSWCSADPICSEHLGGQGSKLANLAACHACMLLPEISCETTNHGLDRATLVGTPADRSPGFFSDLIHMANEP